MTRPTKAARRRGCTPLRPEGVAPTMVCLPPSLRDRLDDFGERNGFTSRSAVVRAACQRLLDQAEATGQPA